LGRKLDEEGFFNEIGYFVNFAVKDFESGDIGNIDMEEDFSEFLIN